MTIAGPGRDFGRAAAGAGRASRGRPGREGPRAALSRRARSAGTDRFGLLLLFLVATYILSAFVAGSWVNGVQIVSFLAVATLAARSGRVHRRTAHRVIVGALAGSVVALVLAFTRNPDVVGVANLWTAAVLLTAVVLIVRRVLAEPEVSLQSIYGAVSAYLIIGLMFAALYSAMNKFGGHFFVTGEPEDTKTFQYFSFTTLTTLGYGDFTAAASGGRAVAVMEALLGQVFLATLVARLVSAFRNPSRSARAPSRPRPGRGRTLGPRQECRSSRRGPSRVTRTSSPGRARPARRSPPRPGR